LNIFRADTSHIPLIRDLTMQVWPQTYTPIIGADQVAYMLDRFYNPDALSAQMNEQGHQFIIGEVDGKPAAFASYSEVEPGVFKLHKLYTTLAAQGKGLGRALVDYIVADIRVKNANMLRLNVNIHNHAAKKFYARYGFRHLLDEDIDIGSSFFMNDHVLCLDINYHTA
jgi:GNAT superfamily N-acetyltransferase